MFRVAAPEVAPPVNPDPATTDVISESLGLVRSTISFESLIYNLLALLSYANSLSTILEVVGVPLPALILIVFAILYSYLSMCHHQK